MAKRGRPFKVTDPDVLQKRVDDYFDSLNGELMLDDEGKPVLYKGEPVFLKKPKPATYTGLALACGFSGRASLYDYKKLSDDEENDSNNNNKTEEEKILYSKLSTIVTRAMSRIEEYQESRLFDKDGCNGAKFSLSHNAGWREKTDISVDGVVNIITPEQAKSALAELGYKKSE